MFRDIETKSKREFYETIKKYKRQGYKVYKHIGFPDLKEMQVVIMNKGIDIIGVSIWNCDILRGVKHNEK